MIVVFSLCDLHGWAFVVTCVIVNAQSITGPIVPFTQPPSGAVTLMAYEAMMILRANIIDIMSFQLPFTDILLKGFYRFFYVDYFGAPIFYDCDRPFWSMFRTWFLIM